MIIHKTINNVNYLFVRNKFLGYSVLRFKDKSGQNCEIYKYFNKARRSKNWVKYQNLTLLKMLIMT